MTPESSAASPSELTVNSLNDATAMAAEAGDADREGRRRRRRGGRGRDRDDTRVDTPLDQETSPGAQVASADVTDVSAAQTQEPQSEDSAEAHRRRGRGRDRLRRDRRPDGDASASSSSQGAEGDTAPPSWQGVEGDGATHSSSHETESHTAPASWQGTEGHAPSPSWQGAEGHTPSPSLRGAEGYSPSSSLRGAEGDVAISTPPPIEPYVLPLEHLHRIAQDSGLQWVNSDAEKIAAAQAAIAAEPKPVHVPREPKPPVVIDEGPLILVETRKDLSQVKLPFEA